MYFIMLSTFSARTGKMRNDSPIDQVALDKTVKYPRLYRVSFKSQTIFLGSPSNWIV